MSRILRIGFVALLAGVLTACHHGPTEQEQKVMAQLIQSMQPQCIGRYLVDLPKDFRWRKPRMTLYFGRDENFKTLEVEALSQNTAPESFLEAVAAEKHEVASKKLFTDQDKSLLLSEKNLGGDQHEIMLNYYSDPSGIGIDHQLHLLIGQTHILIKGSSFEGSSTDPSNLSAAVKSRMLELAQHIRPVTDPEDAGPGFCLGSIVVDSDNDYETSNLYFVPQVGKLKHVSFEFSSSTFKESDSEEPDLLHRGGKFLSMVTSVDVLRKDSLAIGNMPGQEVLMTRSQDGSTSQYFVAETNPPKMGLANPKWHVELRAGKALGRANDVTSPLTQNEAIGLWDAVIKSIRSRAGAVRATPDS